MKQNRLILALGFATLTGLAQPFSLRTEPVIGGPCEGCELIYVGMPTTLASQARIAEPTEPGQPLVLTGTVRLPDGTPAPGVVVYAYHTNARGIYPPAATGHGRLRGWAITDPAGQYRFETIRPAAYPTHTEPQHIHMHVIERGKGTYYIQDVWFDDDPLVKTTGKSAGPARGGRGLTSPRKDAAGVLQVRRDIVLGQNIPGY
jgi:protocatechuate 3,4-dioxygenase beta subunit